MKNVSYIKIKWLYGFVFVILLFGISIVGCNSAKDASSNNNLGQQLVSVQVTESTVITFPDKNLEKLIRDKIQCPSGDILKDDVDNITELENAQNKHIKNLSGIENLTSLVLLNLNNNQISNIQPLKELTNLTELNLATNQISNIDPLKGLTKLTNLNLNTNKTSNIEPLKGLIKLTKLNLNTNQMSNIDALKGLTKLTDLDLAANQMSNIEPLKGLTRLTNLNLAYNKMSNIEPLKRLTRLTNLNLAANQMSNIEPLKGLTNLTDLDLNINQISDTEPLKELTKLTDLNLGTNQVNDYVSGKDYTLSKDFSSGKDFSTVSNYNNNLKKTDTESTDITLDQKAEVSNQAAGSTATTSSDKSLGNTVKVDKQDPIGDILNDDVNKITNLQNTENKLTTNLSKIESPTDSTSDTNQISNVGPIK